MLKRCTAPDGRSLGRSPPQHRLKRPRSGHVMPWFFSMSFSELEANILKPTPRLGTVLSFASQIQGDLSFQIGYIYHYSWYPWYILISAVSISATFFKHQTSRGVQLSGGKPMPRRVIQRGEFTAANSGLKKMGGRWPGTPMTPESIDGIRMYTVYV